MLVQLHMGTILTITVRHQAGTWSSHHPCPPPANLFISEPLAYVTAVTHGLTKEAEVLREQLEQQTQTTTGAGPMKLPQPNPNATLLLPSPPVTRPDKSDAPVDLNWPLLSVHQDIFEAAITQQQHGEKTHVGDGKESTNVGGLSRIAMMGNLEDFEDGAWGKDADLDLDGKSLDNVVELVGCATF